MHLPRITIITPSFNQGAFIGETIDSVLGQGYPDLEYLVLDGGSTDTTLDVLRRYGEQVRWVSEPDGGQSDAINKGMAMATGEVVAFLNSDDRYRPGALLAVGAHFAAHPEAGWLTGRCGIIDTAGRPARGAITAYKHFWLSLGSGRVLRVLNYISQPATFWRRSLAQLVGPLDEGLHYTMDYDYWLRLSAHGAPAILDRYLADFRVHPASKGGTGAARQFAEELATARRHTRSRLLLGLHALHSRAIVGTYGLMSMPRPRAVASGD